MLARPIHGDLVHRWGHKWVVLALRIKLPVARRSWAIPLLVAIYPTPEESKKQRAQRLIVDRHKHVTLASAYDIAYIAMSCAVHHGQMSFIRKPTSYYRIRQVTPHMDTFSSSLSIAAHTNELLRITDAYCEQRTSRNAPELLIEFLESQSHRSHRLELLRELLRIDVEFLSKENANANDINYAFLLKRHSAIEAEVRKVNEAEIFGPAQPPQVRTHVGSYVLKKRLNEGGAQALIYLAYDTRLRRNVAIKMSRSTDNNASVLQDAVLSGAIDDPFVIPTYNSGVFRGLAFISIQYFEYSSLDTCAAQLRKLKLPDFLRHFSRLCRTVQNVHDTGIRHNDIKPSNILVTLNNELVLADFGLATALDVWFPSPEPTTLGTPNLWRQNERQVSVLQMIHLQTFLGSAQHCSGS